MSVTRIEVVTDGDGEPRLTSSYGGVYQARRLPSCPGQVRVALVARQALLLAGDEVGVEIDVSGQVIVEVVEVAGTVCYDMRGGAARSSVTLRLSRGARLSWHGEPLVVSQGADVDRHLQADLGTDCRLALRETVVLGRHGEEGGTIRLGTRIAVAQMPVLIEDLDLAPGVRRGWAVTGSHRVVDTATTVGFRLPDAVETLQLEHAGSVFRHLGHELHRSAMGPTWHAACAGLATPPDVRPAH